MKRVLLMYPGGLSLARFASLFVYVSAVLVVVVLFWRWSALPSEAAVKNDALQNLQMAYNFAEHNVLSRGEAEADLAPTNYREPLPPVVWGIYIKALQLFRGPLAFEFLREGPGARLMKLSNVFWSVLLCLSVAAALRVLTGSSLLALLGTLIVGMNANVDTLLTELPAAALLALVSFLAMMAIKTRIPPYYGFAGLSLGALILTKGAFLYVSLGLIACLVLWLIFQWRRGVQITALGPMLFVLGIILVIGPWTVRNYAISGDPAITERGGGVLLIRALKDQMNWTEYLGSFYVWAPKGWIKRTVGNVLGFGEDDLKRGGRLQRLNRDGEFVEEDRAAYSAGLPEAAITYYRRAGAEWQKIYLQMLKQGHPHPESAADQEAQKLAVKLIRAHPFRHIAMTLPFLWRGAAFIAPLLALFATAAMLWRRYDLLAYMLPAIGLVVFLALATHNLPRYNAPAWPIITVLAITLAQVLTFRIWRRYGQLVVSLMTSATQHRTR